VYSPSQTAVFSECQVKRELRHWTSKYATKGTVAKWMGTAMAAGLAVINTHRMHMDGEWEMAEAHQAAHAAFDEELLAFQNAGGVVSLDQWDRLPALIERGLTHYTMHDPIPVTWLIKGVEQSFPDHGDARPDLIVQDNDGLAPLDYKLKESIWTKQGETKEAGRSRALAEYEHSWQMLHYVWGLHHKYAERCDHYYVCLGELSPRPHYTLQRFDVTDAVLGAWERSAEQYWWLMHAIDEDTATELFPAMAAHHRNQYGECEYKWACFEANLDPERMSHKYVKVERRRESAVKAAE
jgi:hypothetical protein